MIDSKKRSLVKAISWRLIAICILAVVSFLLLGDLKTASLITLFYHVIQVAIYMFHERMWNYISWGKTKGVFIQMTGLSGAGKTTLAKNIEHRLKKRGLQVEVIDGDEYRENLCQDLGFSKEDRNTNIKRLSFVGKVLSRNNVICIMSAINPYDSVRKEIKQMNASSKLVYAKCGDETLKKRDPKGLYKRALLPKGDPNRVDNFTGISDPYEAPQAPDLIIDTENLILENALDKLENFIAESIE